jgi:hypothetical protein
MILAEMKEKSLISHANENAIREIEVVVRLLLEEKDFHYNVLADSFIEAQSTLMKLRSLV